MSDLVHAQNGKPPQGKLVIVTVPEGRYFLAPLGCGHSRLHPAFSAKAFLMGVWLKRFDEYRLELYAYRGAVTPEDMFRHFRKLDPTAKWLSYFDRTADLSGVDLANLPALKVAITAKEHEKSGGEPRRHALVSVSEFNAPFARFWSVYAAMGVPIAHERAVLPTLEEACVWLGVPAAAHAAIASAVREEAPRKWALVLPQKDDPQRRGPHA